MQKRLVEEVFVTEGVPEFTFIQPPNFGEILVDIRRSGKPVIIEGQSGTGKTTCVKKILERIGGFLEPHYLTARKAEHVSQIESLVRDPVSGLFVIDDFHRLASDLQTRLADLAKTAAEESESVDLPKLVLIGINQVGSELIQLVPDIAKRTGIHRINPGSKEMIEALISAGCAKLNISIKNPEALFGECQGDYWLTQQLCQTMCVNEDVYETLDAPKELVFELELLRTKVVSRLQSSYYPAVKEFSRGRRFRPSNDPYYRLLRAVAEQESSIVDINELANANPDVRGSINNIKEKRLNVLLEEKPTCAAHFYYNSETKNFALEDPALFYFLRHLDWDKLRRDCGFREEEVNFEYDFAISFAGEKRELARHIANQLAILDVNVFFDELFEANFLGKAWGTEFNRIFAEASRLVICLLDKNHYEKIWPTFERECFQPRVADAAVIPIRLNDTPFVGLPKDIVGIHFDWDDTDAKWEDKVVDEIVFKLMDRLEAI